MTPVRSGRLAAAPRPRWWQWATVLSLDAPIVTVLWQALLARVALVQLDWGASVVLGLSVWLAYAADRWIEGWRLDEDVVRTPRHRFYQRHRWSVAIVWTLAFLFDIWVAFARLSRFDFAAGSVLLAAVAAYLLSHQLVHRHHPWRLPKELVIAVLLSGGVAVFMVRGEAAGRLAIPLLLLALLCFTNTALISVWERQIDHAHGQTSLAVDHGTAVHVIHRLPWLVAVIAAVAIATGEGAGRIAAVCACASAILLAVTDRAEQGIGPQLARVLSDVALMSPAIPLIWS